jgi:hypothetical protein
MIKPIFEMSYWMMGRAEEKLLSLSATKRFLVVCAPHSPDIALLSLRFMEVFSILRAHVRA